MPFQYICSSRINVSIYLTYTRSNNIERKLCILNFNDKTIAYPDSSLNPNRARHIYRVNVVHQTFNKKIKQIVGFFFEITTGIGARLKKKSFTSTDFC